MDIHDYEKKYQQVPARIKRANISEKNKNLILQMNNTLILEGLSKPRLMKYMEILKLFAQNFNKDFDQVTIEDVKKEISRVQQSNFSPWTKQTYKVIIRRFYRWLHGTKEYPELVKWISIRMKKSECKLPSEGDLLTEKEVVPNLRKQYPAGH